MTSETEMAIQRARLTAELNEEYFRVRAARASRMDRAVQILAAVTSLGALTAWIASARVLQGPWATLLIVSAVLSATSPIVRWFDDAVKFTGLAARWSRVAGRLRILAVTPLEDASAVPKLRRVTKAMEKLQSADTSAPDGRLVRKLQDKVERRHGLVPT